MIDTETLQFRIKVSGTGSSVPCKFQILVNDKVYIESISNSIGQYYEFSAEISQGDHMLQIVLLDKNQADIIKDVDGNLISDFLLNIEDIEVDQINLEQLLWTHSKYYPDYPENFDDLEQKAKKEIHDCVTLGWNGRWTLPFQSPFYIWLLDNL